MAWDAIWEQVFKDQPWGKYPNEEIIRFIARHYYSAPNRHEVSVLELGCGPGANLWFLAREGFNVYGIDGSPTAVAMAESYLNESCPDWRGEVIQGDIVRLPYADHSFDAVIDSEVVYCNSFENSIQIYKEAYRVLKPGGRMFVRTFAEGSWGDGTGIRMADDAWVCAEGPNAGKGYSRFTKETQIPDLLTDFEILSTETVSRSGCARKALITEWIIECMKKK